MQHKEAAAKKADNQYEMSKPMARYNDDQDLNALLKQKGRQDDPMNRFTEKKKKSTAFFASSTFASSTIYIINC